MVVVTAALPLHSDRSVVFTRWRRYVYMVPRVPNSILIGSAVFTWLIVMTNTQIHGLHYTDICGNCQLLHSMRAG